MRASAPSIESESARQAPASPISRSTCSRGDGDGELDADAPPCPFGMQDLLIQAARCLLRHELFKTDERERERDGQGRDGRGREDKG